jgi:hypothetical protein
MEVDAQAMTSTLPSVFLWLAAGMLIGSPYWVTLRWSVGMLATGRSMALAIAMQLVRFAALAVALAFVAIHWGALALLVSAGGLMLARAAVLRRVARR